MLWLTTLETRQQLACLPLAEEWMEACKKEGIRPESRGP